jgi:hypothetical protein
MRSLALLGLEDCPHLPPLGNRAGQMHTVVALITSPRAHAYCPTLLAYAAATWGATREEVLGHIGEMAEMIVERLVEGASVPIAPTDQEPVMGEQIVVTVCAPLEEDAPHPASA